MWARFFKLVHWRHTLCIISTTKGITETNTAFLDTASNACTMEFTLVTSYWKNTSSVTVIQTNVTPAGVKRTPVILIAEDQDT